MSRLDDCRKGPSLFTIKHFNNLSNMPKATLHIYPEVKFCSGLSLLKFFFKPNNRKIKFQFKEKHRRKAITPEML